MQLSISRETFVRALRHTSNVVEKRSTIAILGNVRLHAQNNRLETTATDNDIAVQGTAEAFVDKPGTTTVGALKLFEIINKIPEGSMVGLELADGGSRLTVTAGKSKFSLATLGAEAFPDMTKISGGTSFTLSAVNLKKLLDRVQFATSADETRAYLTGVSPCHSSRWPSPTAHRRHRWPPPRQSRYSLPRRRRRHARRHSPPQMCERIEEVG